MPTLPEESIQRRVAEVVDPKDVVLKPIEAGWEVLDHAAGVTV